MPSARAAAIAGAMMRQLFAAEQAAFAGVRVEAGHGDARPRLAPAGRRGVGDAQGLEHGIEGDRVDRLAQRHVDRDEHRAQLVVGQHHAHRRHDAAARRQRLQHFGVAGIGDASRGERLLVDRRGDDRRRLARLARGAPPPRCRPRRPRRPAHRRGRAARRGGPPAAPRPAAPVRSAAARAAASAGASITATGSSVPSQRRGAAHDGDVADHERRPRHRAAANSRATISGPMPQASPIVIASGRGGARENHALIVVALPPDNAIRFGRPISCARPGFSSRRP